MFQFDESLDNPIDQLAYAKSLIVFLNDIATQGAEEITFSKNGKLGLSIILDMVYNIMESAESNIRRP